MVLFPFLSDFVFILPLECWYITEFLILLACGGGIISYFYRALSYNYSIDIPLTVEIGGGLLMPHNGPVVINLNAKIGKNCTLHPCTLIGGQRGKGVPIIGDNVFIGHGAKVIGSVKVSDWTFICPNTVVVKDTKEGTTISGIPAKILNYDGKKNVELYLLL